MDEKKDKQRTLAQNRALHLLFGKLADELNEAGWDMKRTLRADIDIPWTPTSIKEHIWRPVQKAQFQKDSTTELTTKEIDAVFDTITRHLGTTTGVFVNFPSIEDLLLEKQARGRK